MQKASPSSPYQKTLMPTNGFDISRYTDIWSATRWPGAAADEVQDGCQEDDGANLRCE